MENSKPYWKSRTISITWIVATMAFIPGFQEFNAANPTIVPVGFGVLATLLRLITKDKVSIE